MPDCTIILKKINCLAKIDSASENATLITLAAEDIYSHILGNEHKHPYPHIDVTKGPGWPDPQNF